MENLHDYSSTRKRVFRDSPEIRALWKKTALKRRIGLMLARMRDESGLSQKDITQKTGWDKGFVSRLESANYGGVPDLQTLARFADNCGLTIGLVVCERPNKYNDARVIDAVSLFEAPKNHQDFSYLDEPNCFANLVNKTISLK